MKKKLSFIILTVLLLLCLTSTAQAATNTAKTVITTLSEKAEGKVYVAFRKQSVDGYQLRWSLNSDFSKAKTASTKKTTWYRSGLIGGKTYYFQVRTYRIVNGKKAYSGWSSTKYLKLKILPTSTTITNISSPAVSKFTVKWKKQKTVSGYQIRYSTDSSFKTRKTASTTYTAVSRSKLAEGVYYVSVRTYNIAADGTKYYSAWSSPRIVTVESARIALDQTEAELGVGDSFALQATVEGPGKSIVWTSSDETIATVSSTGLVKAVKIGKATITAEANGKKATCTVNITDNFDLKDYVGKDYHLLLAKVPMLHWDKNSDPAGAGNIYVMSYEQSGFYFRYDLNTGIINLFQNDRGPDIPFFGVRLGMNMAKAKEKVISQGWLCTETTEDRLSFTRNGVRFGLYFKNDRVESFRWDAR